MCANTTADTGKNIIVQIAGENQSFRVYKSEKPYPAGVVTLTAMAGGRDADPVMCWIIFLEEATLAVEPVAKIATTWGTLKIR